MNPSTALGTVLADELARCGLREVVVAPGSRSTPLAMAFWELEQAGRVRLHVRVDERSASFTALGLAKASGRPVAVLCTSGTAAANFHPAVIEADESAVPLLVLTADRPPELRGTGASQTIDQVKLYGSAVRWYAEAGVPERRPGMAGYWRSLACRAWAQAAGALGTLPGPVHLNLPLRDPLVPETAPTSVDSDNSKKRASAIPAADASVGSAASAGATSAAASGSGTSGGASAAADAGVGSAASAGAGLAADAGVESGTSASATSAADAASGSGTSGRAGSAASGSNGPAADAASGSGTSAGPAVSTSTAASAGAAADAGVGPGADAGIGSGAEPGGWPEPLAGRPGGQPWTRVGSPRPVSEPLEVPWAERGVVVCGDGDYDAAALVRLAERAGWPVLAEPSSGARRGPNALTGYQYLLAAPQFMAAHRPEIIISAGRPGLSRPQSALLGLARAAAGPDGGGAPAVRHVVVASGPGMWADPQRAATDVAAEIRVTGIPGTGAPGTGPGRWLAGWRRADEAAVRAADAVLGEWQGEGALSEPGVARELLAALPAQALAWCGNSMSVRDIDLLMPPRADVRVIASRGASGIDGTFSTAAGAALAHAAEHPGAVAFALIGDLSLLHDAPGLAIGPAEPRPDLCLVVVNNDGGAIFEALEPARFKGPAGGTPGPGGARDGGPSVFERLFGTAHGASVERLAAAFCIPYTPARRPGEVAKAMAAAGAGAGPRIIEARTGRAENAALRARMRAAAVAAAAATVTGEGACAPA